VLISSVIQILDRGFVQSRWTLEKVISGSDKTSVPEGTQQAGTLVQKHDMKAVPAAAGPEPLSWPEVDENPTQPFKQVIRDFLRAVDEASKRSRSFKLDVFE
jgi:hypothetical protein